MYIGRTKDYEQRWKQHCTKKKNPQCVSYIYNAIQEHGRRSFEFDVIATCSEGDAVWLEDYYINWYKALAPHGFNLVASGKAEFNTKKRRSESKLRERRRDTEMPYNRKSLASSVLPRHVYVRNENGVATGYFLQYPGQAQWSIATSKLSMEEKLNRTLEQLSRFKAGDCRRIPSVRYKGRPKYMSYNKARQRFLIDDRIHKKAYFKTQEEAQKYLDSLTA